MKILLLQPNTRYCFNGQVNALPPLGLLYLASALRRAGFGEITLLDARAERLNRRRLRERLRAAAPDLVGITGLTPDAAEMHRCAALAKDCAPGCRVVLGGPYATSDPAGAVSHPAVDFAVRGEGERAVCALAGALANASSPAGIAGLVSRGPGGPVFGPPPAPEPDVDSIAPPAWDLLPLGNYYGSWTRHTMNPFPASDRSLPLFSSRGCPYACVYCHDIFGKRARFRSAESVLDEMELLVNKYGAREIEFVDDIFNLDLDRAKRICDGILRRGLKVRLSFPNGLRADRMDEELVLKLEAAGLHLVFYAVETASPRLQRLIKKNLDLDRTAEIVRFTAARGVTVGGFFMLGFPGETAGEMLATAAYARRLPFTFAAFFFVTPRENTELYGLAGAAARTAGKGNYFLQGENYSAVNGLLFGLLMNWADYGFYLRPGQLPRLLRGVKSWPYFLKIMVRFRLLRAWA